MSNTRIRDPLTDTLITPQNACLFIVDYQPVQVASIRSMDQDDLVKNIVSVAKTAKLFGLPVVLSTVNVKSGINKATIAPILAELGDITAIDRTTVNSWEDKEFRAAIEATGRKKLIGCALWTEVCLTFPVLDALNEGYEVYPVLDAVGGTSVKAHDAGIARMLQAGAQPTTWVQLLCELQRDWNRTNTAERFAEILFGSGHAKGRGAAA
ncbi:MAG: hydrolase [Bdellovibrionota bacterium]